MYIIYNMFIYYNILFVDFLLGLEEKKFRTVHPGIGKESAI